MEKKSKAKALPVGRPARKDKDNTQVPSIEKGTKPGEKRKTYIVNSDLADKVDAIAYWDRTRVKHVVNDAFTWIVNKWEKANGPVKKVPNKK